MIVFGDYTYDHDGTWANLILNLAPGLRLHAACKRGECPNPQAFVSFHLRHNQPWLAEAEVRDHKILHRLAHKSCPIGNASDFFNPSDAGFLTAAKRMIMEMDLPDSAVKIDSWTYEIRKYAIMAAELARAQKPELITIALEFGCSKVTDPSKEATNRGEKDCAICLNSLNQAEMIVTLSCTHMFHCSCLENWFEKKLQCPLCRSPVREAEVFM